MGVSSCNSKLIGVVEQDVDLDVTDPHFSATTLMLRILLKSWSHRVQPLP